MCSNLIWSELGHNGFDVTPEREWEGFVDQPLLNRTLDVTGGEVGYVLGYLLPVHSPVEVEDLVGYGLSDVITSFMLEEFNKESSFGSLEFFFTYVLGVLKEGSLSQLR